MAWWYGWPLREIDELDMEDFLAFQKEAARQIKAGYRKG
ncbi:GpE family phage tail protein [Neisseria sp. 23W00296]